jgi:hypothetical protein
MALRLEIAEFTDANHWRWRLTDADGAFLADHAVVLDPLPIPIIRLCSICRPI